MFNLFLTAAKYRDLVALVLGTWVSMHPGHAPTDETKTVAGAIALAVLESPDGPYDDETKAGLLAVFAERESNVQAHPCAHSKSPTCGDSGAAHGYWQLHQAAGEERAQRQAEVWLALLQYGSAVCPARPLAVVVSGSCDHGTHLAANRLKEAQEAVQAWHASVQAAERSAPGPETAAAQDPSPAVSTASESPPSARP